MSKEPEEDELWSAGSAGKIDTAASSGSSLMELVENMSLDD